jgi:hypothetical protein
MKQMAKESPFSSSKLLFRSSPYKITPHDVDKEKGTDQGFLLRRGRQQMRRAWESTKLNNVENTPYL